MASFVPPRLQQNPVQLCANLIRIGAVDGGWMIFEQISCSFWPKRSPWREEAMSHAFSCRIT